MAEPATMVRVLSGRQRGKVVRQGRAEAESNVASGTARWLTAAEEGALAATGTLPDVRVRSGTVVRPGRAPQRVTVEGDGPIDPAAVVAEVDKAEAGEAPAGAKRNTGRSGR